MFESMGIKARSMLVVGNEYFGTEIVGATMKKRVS